MARNVEIKARVRDPLGVRARAEGMADGPAEIFRQQDTFYSVPEGRLKLRVFPNGEGQLISYQRSDSEGPKTSEYHLFRTSDPDTLHAVLAHALGVRSVVAKERTLLMCGRTRIHLDEVDDLGHFMELEVVLAEGEGESLGVDIAHDLLDRLGISRGDLVAGAYVDLLSDCSEDRR